MYRLSALVMCLCAHAAFAVTADELATKNVEAKGGIDKLHAIQSLRLSGRLRVEHDTIELGYVTYVKQPGSIRYEASLQGLTQVQAYDGTQAWQINPFQGRKDPEKLSADDAKGLGEDAADFTGTLVDYKSKGYKLDYLGTEDIDGTDAHKLRVTRPNGDISVVYLDPDHFLEIRMVNRRIEHGVPATAVARCSVCARPVETSEAVIRLHGLVVHARCAAYRLRAGGHIHEPTRDDMRHLP